jgi:homoserine kinase type II
MGILTKLSKNDFKEILLKYKIGKYKSHVHIDWALTNSVYKITTTKGKFILKIFEDADPKFIRFQIKIIDFLEKNKVPVAKISKMKNGQEILIYKRKRIIIQKFMEGQYQEKYDEKTLKDVGKNFGLMSRVLLKMKKTGEYTGKVNHQFKSFGIPNIKLNNFDFKKEERKLLFALKEIDRKKLRKSIIHGDFHGVNILIKGDKVSVILDFDDSHEDYIAYEVAIFMIDPFIEELTFDKKAAKKFFKEYQKSLKLNTEEKKALYYFIKQRLLGVIGWHQKQLKIHKDKKKRLLKSLNKMTLKYESFNKITLEDFLELF